MPEHKTLEQLNEQINGCNGLQALYSQIAEDVKTIKETLLGRPTWQITAVIGTLTAVCSFLATALLTKWN